MSTSPARPLLFARAEQRLAAMDALPRAMWLGALTNALGDIEPRLRSLATLRETLITGLGADPTSLTWPAPTIARALLDTIQELELPRLCTNQPELAHAVLMSALVQLDLIEDYRDRGASEEEAVAMAITAFHADWSKRCGEIQELIAVLGPLPDGAKNMQWDALHGVLRSEGWQDVLRIRRLLDRTPEIAELIRRLGRARSSDEPDAPQQAVVANAETANVADVSRPQAPVPDIPGETVGVRPSDRIARMLPAEAMLLKHPLLRLVWHARRAERTLLTFEDTGPIAVDTEHRKQGRRPWRQSSPAPRLAMGPILVCLDTSGSMQGGAEAVAKAVVLEAMRTAHAQGRACHVFAFGGPDEIRECELGFDLEGISRLTSVLSQAFHGGTEISGPLERAMDRLMQQQWQQADLLIASDGEFGATATVVNRLRAIKAEQGLRVQGVLVGDRETIGFLEIADAIHWVRDWRRLGGHNADAPVHSHRLTAMYFPAALRSAENAHMTLPGDAASHAVRTPQGRH